MPGQQLALGLADSANLNPGDDTPSSPGPRRRTPAARFGTDDGLNYGRLYQALLITKSQIKGSLN